MTGYNPLNKVKVNLESVGICQFDGMRFTDPNCPHGTPEQIAHCKEIDERMDNEDIFGHPIQDDDAWLSSRSFVRQPFNDHGESVPVGERVAILQGTSELSHKKVVWSHSPDGRMICDSCGCWSYENHYSHCKYSFSHDAELDGTGNDPGLVTELRGGF